jgi:Zn2+/Cd2+-exporting ATPase
MQEIKENDISCACEDIDLKQPEEKPGFKEKLIVYTPLVLSILLLFTGIILDRSGFLDGLEYVRLAVYSVSYLLVGGPVVWRAIQSILKGDVFNEFFLMSIATLGAFYIGQFAEGVAVMLFYTIGEMFQDAAVNRAKNSIAALLNVQSDVVTVLKDGKGVEMDPRDVETGQVIQVLPGEKVALDGVLMSDSASFNTAALTGESVPDTIRKGGQVLAGMINLNTLCTIQTTTGFQDTKLSKILEMVQDAVSRKAKTQRFITRFAKIYTPIVVFLAIALVLIPYFFVQDYIFNDWLYRGLVFLVISCPCALVISIPLGYFGGIGAASRNGILFKGSDYLDLISKVDTVVMDKTGTLTKGVFEVQEVYAEHISKKDLLFYMSALESLSTHPIAKALVKYTGTIESNPDVQEVEEIPGHGMKGKVDGHMVLVGNRSLLNRFKVEIGVVTDSISETVVLIAVDGRYAGYITIADSLKEDALEAVELLHKTGIKKIVMLSGDKQTVVDAVASKLGIDEAIGGLMPEDKISEVEKLKSAGRKVVFIGDGVNDAPVITLSDVGMAMGGLGSDAAIETADVVIQTDHPSKIAMAIRIGKATNHIVWQNIALALGVKTLVMILGAMGMATLWQAVFADVGVALLAILNAVRIQRMNFKLSSR